MILYAMFAAIMFISKLLMEFLPNMHLIGMLTLMLTLVYRARALIPLYLFVALTGVYYGFGLWWVPYLYIWTVLWAFGMLLPRPWRLPAWGSTILYSSVCAAHGLLYGTLYAPFQALAMGMGWQGMIAWIVAGFPFDVIHGVSNFVAGLLILPMAGLLCRLEGIYLRRNPQQIRGEAWKRLRRKN